jgi:restriction system protein
MRYIDPTLVEFRRQTALLNLQIKAQKEKERQEAAIEKTKRQLAALSKQEQAKKANEEVDQFLGTLDNILLSAVNMKRKFGFSSLLSRSNFKAFVPPLPVTDANQEVKDKIWESIPTSMVDKPPGLEFYLSQLEPWKWYSVFFRNREKELSYAKQQQQWALGDYNRRNYEARNKEFETRHAQWLEFHNAENLIKAKTAHAEEKAAFEREKGEANARIYSLESKYLAGDVEAVISFNERLLQCSEYPQDFPSGIRVEYVASSKELVVEKELPEVKIIPVMNRFRYIKADDTVEGRPRKVADIRNDYANLIAAIALRTMYEVFSTDDNSQVESIIFNGVVDTIDSKTGLEIRPHLISVRAVKEDFLKLNFNLLNKVDCVKSLGAATSPLPDEAVAVKPIVEFNMVDRRFVDGKDILSELDDRPNLMDINPFDFEKLIGNLFDKMGLDTRQTRSSRDGGVDVVAFDTRPIFGGKVVIQAKRYKHTVSVSAVRDLYGAMTNERATKGILVTTSGYGSDAIKFACDKPIELITGENLLYLLKEHAQLDARIIMPPDAEAA